MKMLRSLRHLAKNWLKCLGTCSVSWNRKELMYVFSVETLPDSVLEKWIKHKSDFLRIQAKFIQLQYPVLMRSRTFWRTNSHLYPSRCVHETANFSKPKVKDTIQGSGISERCLHNVGLALHHGRPGCIRRCKHKCIFVNFLNALNTSPTKIY